MSSPRSIAGQAALLHAHLRAGESGRPRRSRDRGPPAARRRRGPPPAPRRRRARRPASARAAAPRAELLAGEPRGLAARTLGWSGTRRAPRRAPSSGAGGATARDPCRSGGAPRRASPRPHLRVATTRSSGCATIEAERMEAVTASPPAPSSIPPSCTPTASCPGSSSTSACWSWPRTSAAAAGARQVPRDLRVQPGRVLHGARGRPARPGRRRHRCPRPRRAGAGRDARADRRATRELGARHSRVWETSAPAARRRGHPRDCACQADELEAIDRSSPSRSSPCSRRWRSGRGGRSPTSRTSRCRWRSGCATRSRAPRRSHA